MDQRSNLKNYRNPQKPPQASTTNNNQQALNSTPAQDRTRLPTVNPSPFPTAKQPKGSRTSSSSSRVTPPAVNFNGGNREQIMGSNNQRVHGQAMKTKKTVSSSTKKYLNLNRTPVKRMNPPSPVKKFLPSGSGSTVPQEKRKTEIVRQPFFSIPRPPTGPTFSTLPAPPSSALERPTLASLTKPISLGQNTLNSRNDIVNGTSSSPTRILIVGGRRQVPDSTSTPGFVYQQATDEELRVYGKNYDGAPLSGEEKPVSEVPVNRNQSIPGTSNAQTTAASTPVAAFLVPHPSTVLGAQVDIGSRPSAITSVQNNHPVRNLDGPTVPRTHSATTFDLISTPVATTHTNLSSPLLLGLSKQGRQSIFVPNTLTANSTPIPPSPTEIPQPSLVTPDGNMQKSTFLPPKQAPNFVDSQVNTQSALPPALPQLQVPSPQVQTNSQTPLEDRIAERVFALLQPAVLRVAEIGKVQKGMMEMIQGMQNSLHAAEKERRARKEKAKHSATECSNMQMDVDEFVTEGFNAQTPKEGKDKEDKAVMKAEDAVKSILILADRVHAVVEDLGVVKRVLGVSASAGDSSDAHGAVEHEKVVGEYAMRGRKRRKLASLSENTGATGQEEELILVDGECEALSSNVPPKTDTHEKQRRSILDRLESMEMDLQECLERAKDPLAGAHSGVNDKAEKEKDIPRERHNNLSLSVSVVRHEIGTSPIKLPSGPLSVKRTQRQPLIIKSKFRLNAPQDSRQKDLISLGNAPSSSGDKGGPSLMFATRRPNGSTTAQAKPSLASLTSSGISFSSNGSENKENKNQMTMVEDQESDANEDDEYDELAESDAELVGADADQDHDVFGPLKLNSSPAASTTSDYHLPELQSGKDRVNEDGNASNAGNIAGNADVIMGDSESEHALLVEGPSDGPSITQSLTNFENDVNVDVSTRASTHPSRPKTQRSGSSIASGFSPVDWSKEQKSAGRSASSPAAQAVRITPKLKLRLGPSPPHNGPTTTPPPLSAPVPNPLTSSRSWTPVRSYTMPPLPEGSIAELRQQTLGVPFLSFNTETAVGSRQEAVQPKAEGRVQMVIGADAAERMLSPESQVSKEDEDEVEDEDESMVQEEEKQPDSGSIEGDGGEVKESSLPATEIQSTESTVVSREMDMEERDIPVPQIEMASVRSGPSKSPSPSDNISSPVHMNAKIAPSLEKVDQIKDLSNSEIPPPASQTTEDEAVVNSLVVSMSQSSDAQAQTQLPHSPLERLSDLNDIVASSCSPSPTQKQEEKSLFSQDDSASSHKSPLFSSSRRTTASPPPHTDFSHHEDDLEEETEENIVKAKQELNSPRQVPKTGKRGTESNAEPEHVHIPTDSEFPPPQIKTRPRPKPKPKQKAVVAPEIIDIDELPTPKKAAPKQKKKNLVKRESSIISISSCSEDEVVETKVSTSSVHLTSGGTSKTRPQRRPRPPNRGSLVKLEVFTQSTASNGSDTPAPASVSSHPVASSSRSTKKIGPTEPLPNNELLHDGEAEAERQMPHAPSTPPLEPLRLTRSTSKSGKGRQLNPSSRSRSPSESLAHGGSKPGRSASRSKAKRKPRIPSSPLSDPPSDVGPEPESDEEAVPKSSFDINKYTAKLVDDDADIIKVKSKFSASSAGRNNEAEVDASDKSKSGLQNLIANRKKAKENSKALTKIKKRKRVASGGTSLGNGLEDEDDDEPVDEYDKPPLKRVKMRPAVQKGKETASPAKGKGKEKEKGKTISRRIGQDDHSENASTISSQSRHPLHSPQKTASTSKSGTSHSSKITTKTPRKLRGSVKALEAVKWPTVQKPDFSQHIECDNCDGWYHIGCVGVESHDIRLQPSEIYTCPICEAGIDKNISPVKNVTETDIKAKSDCARPDCLREAMKSKSKKHSPSTSTVPRGRGRPRKVKIEDKEASSPVDDKYIVERFIGRWKRYVGGEGLVFEYLVKWHNYGFDEATWQSIESLEMTNPDICVEGFHKAAAKENYDLQNGDEEVVLLREAAEAGWTLERTFEPPEK